MDAKARIGHSFGEKSVVKQSSINSKTENKETQAVKKTQQKQLEDESEKLAEISEEKAEIKAEDVSPNEVVNVDEEEKSRLQKRREEIAKERAMETSKFKQNAIKNTERREKKHEEILKRKREKESDCDHRV